MCCIFYTKIKEQIKQKLTLKIDPNCKYLPSTNNLKNRTNRTSQNPSKKASSTKNRKKPAPHTAPNNPKSQVLPFSAATKTKYPAPQLAANRKKSSALPLSIKTEIINSSTHQ